MRYTELAQLTAEPDDGGVAGGEPIASREPVDEPWGPRKNWRQLSVALLLTFNVGAVLSIHKMAMLDSSGRQFGQTTYASKTSFLIPFAFVKAFSNLAVGPLADALGRKSLEAAGWAAGLLAPALVLAAPTDESGWPLVVASAALLGLQQGLCWSVTVLLCIDLCGPRLRGLASGMNESLGYSAVAIFVTVYSWMEKRSVSCAWADGSDGESPNACGGKACRRPDDWVSSCTGVCLCKGYTGFPFKAEITIIGFSLVVSLLLVRETAHTHVATEQAERRRVDSDLLLRRQGGAAGASSSDSDDEGTGDGTGGAQRPGGGDQSACEVAKCWSRHGAEPGPLGGGFAWHASDGSREARALSGAASGPPSAQDRVREFAGVFMETVFRNPSTAAVCAAGFAANLLTGLAWGLIASWARDGLRFSADARNFSASCYSLPKGLAMARDAQGSLQFPFQLAALCLATPSVGYLTRNVFILARPHRPSPAPPPTEGAAAPPSPPASSAPAPPSSFAPWAPAGWTRSEPASDRKGR